MNARACVGYKSQCRCYGNVVCNKHWTKEHTIVYKMQQSKIKNEKPQK